jgi:hypothetical protein
MEFTDDDMEEGKEELSVELGLGIWRVLGTRTWIAIPIDNIKKKLKDSKSHEVASSSSSNKDTDASFEEEAKGKRGRKGDKRSYNTTSFNYDNLLQYSAFTLVPIGNPPPPPFRWYELYQMEVLDEDASNLAQSERVDSSVCRCWLLGRRWRTKVWATLTNS